MEANVKPRTRCECRDARCTARPEAKPGNSPGYPGHPHYQCNQVADVDAVVYVKGDNDPLPIPVVGKHCAACARWHGEQSYLEGCMVNRCQCASRECCECISRKAWPTGRCIRPAIRIVTVQGPTPTSYMKEHADLYAYQVPMCAACAEYHEARQVAK